MRTVFRQLGFQSDIGHQPLQQQLVLGLVFDDQDAVGRLSRRHSQYLAAELVRRFRDVRSGRELKRQIDAEKGTLAQACFP